MLMHNDLASASVLVFANKSDLPEHKPISELVQEYGLDTTKHELHVQACSAVTGLGLREGLDWLAVRI